jgi:hypothetical protein
MKTEEEHAARVDDFIAQVRTGLDDHALVVTIFITPQPGSNDSGQVRVIANVNNDRLVLEGLFYAVVAATEAVSAETAEQILHHEFNGKPLLWSPHEARDA